MAFRYYSPWRRRHVRLGRAASNRVSDPTPIQKTPHIARARHKAAALVERIWAKAKPSGKTADFENATNSSRLAARLAAHLVSDEGRQVCPDYHHRAFPLRLGSFRGQEWVPGPRDTRGLWRQLIGINFVRRTRLVCSLSMDGHADCHLGRGIGSDRQGPPVISGSYGRPTRPYPLRLGRPLTRFAFDARV
jgi:hypothetical protein